MAKKKTVQAFEISGDIPNDRNVERYVLSCLLMGDQAEAILALNDEAFFHKDIREIFRAAKRLKAAEGKIDLIKILGELGSDAIANRTFDSIGRDTLAESWSGSEDSIRALMRKRFTEVVSSYSGSGSLIFEQLDKLKAIYTKRAAIEAATLLSLAAESGDAKLIESLSEVQGKISRATSQNFASIFANTTKEEIEERRKINLEGIGTKYYVFADGKRMEIKIPRGQISLVCALPGHCKSTLLLNLALRLANTEEGKIIYWTFEESKERTSQKFESLNYGKKLTKSGLNIGGNVDRIREYHKGKTDYIEDSEEFRKSLEDLEKMETSGKLKIISENMTSLDFVSALRAHMAQSKEKIAAVFVDYIQIVKSGRNLETRIDIAEALNDFLTFAKETNIPVIAAAQLNRDAKTPQMMGGRHIAESADLTRFADTILCLWNPLKEDDLDLKPKELEEWKGRSWYIDHMRTHRANIGEPGSLYVKVTKARDIAAGADAVYRFDGDIRSIGRTPKVAKEYTQNAEDLPQTEGPNPDGVEKKEESAPVQIVERKNKEIRRH